MNAGVETVKRQNRAAYGYRPKSVSAGLGCGLGCTSDLSVTRSVDATKQWKHAAV